MVMRAIGRESQAWPRFVELLKAIIAYRGCTVEAG